MAIMDRQDYINKDNKLLNQPAYRAIPRDPTNKIKNRIINILIQVKSQTGLDNNTCKAMFPMGCRAPKFNGLSKIHKPDTLLRPIVSSCGLVTYGVAQELTKILKPLVCKFPHHINSTQDFVEQIKQVTVLPGECLSSYDVTALFISVPVDLVLGITKDLLAKRLHPKGKTTYIRGHYSLTRIPPQKYLFFFQGQFYNRLRVWL